MRRSEAVATAVSDIGSNSRHIPEAFFSLREECDPQRVVPHLSSFVFANHSNQSLPECLPAVIRQICNFSSRLVSIFRRKR